MNARAIMEGTTKGFTENILHSVTREC